MSLLGFQRRRRELAAKEAAEREVAQRAAAETKGTKPIDEQTVLELKQYAADNGINLGSASKKADILELIKDWEQGQETLKLRERAATLGIEQVDEKDAETLLAEIAAKESKLQGEVGDGSPDNENTAPEDEGGEGDEK